VYRILHVDDDPLMCEIVDIALGLDPAFMVMSCGGGREAIEVVLDWDPDLILCDVLMPEMDGPALLARLRADAATAKYPLIFTTAGGNPKDRDALKALGAAAVIGKPFDPQTLAGTVRRHLQSIKLAATGYNFGQRLQNDAARLAALREELRNGAQSSAPPDELQSFVHKLAGAAGVFNYGGVSASASALADAIIEARAGRAAPDAIVVNLDALLYSIGTASAEATAGGPP
jgi:CheY-like chemotaxis protein